MRVLVACEESQEVCKAFRARGHTAFSCDIIPCSGGQPEWHIQADAREIIKLPWDLIIAHPPCTFLSCAGAERVFSKGMSVKDTERYERGKQAAEFFNLFLEADCDKIAIENPVIMRGAFGIRKYDQIIHPWQYGHPWHKRTCLWLKNLPLLVPTEIVEPTRYWTQRSGQRARGFRGGAPRPENKGADVSRNRCGYGRTMGIKQHGPCGGAANGDGVPYDLLSGEGRGRVRPGDASAPWGDDPPRPCPLWGSRSSAGGRIRSDERSRRRTSAFPHQPKGK